MTEPTDTQIADSPVPDPISDLVSDILSPTDTPPPADVKPPTEKPADVKPAEEKPKEEKPVEEKPKEDDPLKLDEPEKEPEAKPEEEVIPDAPKSRKDWDTLRASRDRHKQVAEEVQGLLQTKDELIKELQAKVAELPMIQEKLKVFDEYEKELAITRLEATQDYQETILKPLEVIGSQAENLAKSNDTDFDKVLEVIREADPVTQRQKMKEITAGWDEMDRNDLWAMVKDARTLLDKQDSMRQNAAAAAKEQQTLASQREQEAKAQARKVFTEETKGVVSAIKEQVPFIPLAEGETAEDRFISLQTKVETVDFDSQSPRAKAFAAAAAILYPTMRDTIAKLQEEVATLTSRVKDSNSSSPKVSNTEQSAPPQEEDDFLKALGVPQSPMFSSPLNVVGQ